MSAVMNSDLAAWLRPYALAYASFADDDGTHVYPTIRTVARMVRRHRRRVLEATHVLRDLGILEVEQPHARYRATRYHFNVDALPPPGGFPDQLALFPRPKALKAGLKSDHAQKKRKNA